MIKYPRMIILNINFNHLGFLSEASDLNGIKELPLGLKDSPGEFETMKYGWINSYVDGTFAIVTNTRRSREIPVASKALIGGTRE